MHIILLLHGGFRILEHKKLSATGLHFLQIGFEFFQHGVGRRDRYHRHIRIHQRQRAVFQFTRRIGFGMDIGNLFQL